MNSHPFMTVHVSFNDKNPNSNVTRQHIVLTPEQHRQIFNSLYSYASYNPQVHPPMMAQSFNNSEYVTYTFNGRTEVPWGPLYNPYHYPLRPPAPHPIMNLEEQQRLNALQLYQLQSKFLNHPCNALRLHLNNETQTEVDCKVTSTSTNTRPAGNPDKNTQTIVICEKPQCSSQDAEIQTHFCCNCCKHDDPKSKEEIAENQGAEKQNN